MPTRPVWYFTKVPCIGDNVANGLRNYSLLAVYINVDIMPRCTAAWPGTTTLTGGINAIMLEPERQRYEEWIEALLNENRAERQQLMTMIAELMAAQRQQNNGGNGTGGNGQP